MNGEYKRAAEKAMKLLLQQDRTERELRERLQRAGFSEDAVCYAIEYVSGFGYIDDYRYAVHYLVCKKGCHSRKELRHKLLDKGISREILQEAMEEYPAEEEIEPVIYLIHKRLGGRGLSQTEYKDRTRIMAYLARKGFPVPVIRQAMKDLCENP